MHAGWIGHFGRAFFVSKLFCVEPGIVQLGIFVSNRAIAVSNKAILNAAVDAKS